MVPSGPGKNESFIKHAMEDAGKGGTNRVALTLTSKSEPCTHVIRKNEMKEVGRRALLLLAVAWVTDRSGPGLHCTSTLMRGRRKGNRVHGPLTQLVWAAWEIPSPLTIKSEISQRMIVLTILEEYQDPFRNRKYLWKITSIIKFNYSFFKMHHCFSYERRSRIGVFSFISKRHPCSAVEE